MLLRYAFSHVQVANRYFLDEKYSCCLVTPQNAFLSLLLSLSSLVSGWSVPELLLRFFFRFPLNAAAGFFSQARERGSETIKISSMGKKSKRKTFNREQ